MGLTLLSSLCRHLLLCGSISGVCQYHPNSGSRCSLERPRATMMNSAMKLLRFEERLAWRAIQAHMGMETTQRVSPTSLAAKTRMHSFLLIAASICLR